MNEMPADEKEGARRSTAIRSERNENFQFSQFFSFCFKFCLKILIFVQILYNKSYFLAIAGDLKQIIM